VRALNPRARIEIVERGEVPLDAIFDTGLFDEDEAALAPGWVRALNGENTPETDEYGISSFVYRNAWPFHPERLAEALESEWPGVLRSKGFFWLATRPDVQAMWSQAGLSIQLEPLAPWYAAIPESEWEFESDVDRAALLERWDPLLGDRLNELVLIGVDLDEPALVARLDECIVTPAEFELGVDGWRSFDDPLPEWPEGDECEL
jgi:G3E family GTPase